MSGSTAFALAFVGLFVWGLERWRHAAHHRAERTEGARLVALARCLLGPDGATLLREPALARHRMRALAVAAPLDPGPSFHDRCVPFAEALARHATEVDDTNAVTGAQTRVVEATRALAREVKRVGLVWRIRSGDAELDTGLVTDALARVAAELELAGTRLTNVSVLTDAPVAPALAPRPDGVAVHLAGAVAPATGLEPLPAGSPSRFLVGGPLPVVAAVVRDEENSFHVEVLANEPANAYATSGSAVLRIDARPDEDDPGLAMLRYVRAQGDPVSALVTAVPSPLQGLHVGLDGAVVGRVFWFAQWTPFEGSVLARVAPGSPLTALRLAPPPLALDLAAAAERERALANSSADAARSTARDEHVAVIALPRGAAAAYTLRDDGAQVSHVALQGVPIDRPNAPAVSLGEYAFHGRNPALEACADPGATAVLVVPAQREWVVLRVTEAGSSVVFRHEAPRGRVFDERAWVRCSADGLVVYPRENAARGPLLTCGPGGADCVALDPPSAPEPVTLPLYVTRTPSGRALAHGSWPRAFARTRHGVLVAVRGAGPLVSVTRRGPGESSWRDETVLFDAAERTHGLVLDGLEVYAQGDDVLVAASSALGLRVFRSHDEGATFR